MAEKPIIFSGESVRTILDGKKTQTRRIIKRAPLEYLGKIYIEYYEPLIFDKNGEEFAGKPIFGAYNDFGDWGCKFPYGKIGDELWVKETYSLDGNPQNGCLYRATADYKSDAGVDCRRAKWKPSLFMRRENSSITLKITKVRVERLQEIADADAVKEGMPAFFKNNFSAHLCDPFPSDSFADFWKTIHGPASWQDNPYVWVIDFEKI